MIRKSGVVPSLFPGKGEDGSASASEEAPIGRISWFCEEGDALFFHQYTDSTVLGNLQRSRTYGRAGVLDEGGTAAVRTPDGGFRLAGNTHNFSSGFEAYAVKIAGAGNVQWSRTYDGGVGEGSTRS